MGASPRFGGAPGRTTPTTRMPSHRNSPLSSGVNFAPPHTGQKTAPIISPFRCCAACRCDARTMLAVRPLAHPETHGSPAGTLARYHPMSDEAEARRLRHTARAGPGPSGHRWAGRRQAARSVGQPTFFSVSASARTRAATTTRSLRPPATAVLIDCRAIFRLTNRRVPPL